MCGVYELCMGKRRVKMCVGISVEVYSYTLSLFNPLAPSFNICTYITTYTSAVQVILYDTHQAAYENIHVNSARS